MRKKYFIHKLILSVLAVGFAGCLAGCSEGKNIEPSSSTSEITGYVLEKENVDTAIVVAVDEEESTINFQNVETGIRYTLGYDGTTFLSDRYGQPLTASLIKPGVIADISFDVYSKHLGNLSYSTDYFVLDKAEGWQIYNNDTRLKYLDDQYVLDSCVVVASGNEQLDVMELNQRDKLTLYGKNHTIYSISLESGHGYLRLKNDNYFVGGFIEVGTKIIEKIDSGMLLTVPEGSYTVIVSNDGIVGEKNVTVGRNQEVELNLGDIDVEKKFGNIFFITNPPDAAVYVDGEKADISAPVQIEYGIHQLIARADGYDTMSKYINVGTESASVELTLVKSESSVEASPSTSPSPSASPSVEGSPTPSASPTPANEGSSEVKTDPTISSATGKVYIEGPKGAEVYIDGSYIGVAPASFNKKVGTVVVTLRKSGYQTRSYTLNLEDSTTDSSYSFSDMTPIEGN